MKELMANVHTIIVEENAVIGAISKEDFENKGTSSKLISYEEGAKFVYKDIRYPDGSFQFTK